MMNRTLQYYLVSVPLLVIVDFTTTVFPDFAAWFSRMPAIWVFYLGFPVINALLVCRWKLDGKRLLAASILIGAFLEIVLFGNMLLFMYPIILIPIMVALYSLLAFTPKWALEGKLRENWKWLAVVWAAWAFTLVATTAANI